MVVIKSIFQSYDAVDTKQYACAIIIPVVVVPETDMGTGADEPVEVRCPVCRLLPLVKTCYCEVMSPVACSCNQFNGISAVNESLEGNTGRITAPESNG